MYDMPAEAVEESTMHHPSRITPLARLRGWLRHNLRIVVNVVYVVVILVIFLFPVFGKSLLDTWGVFYGVLAASLAGVAGNLIASYIWTKYEPNPPPPGRDAQTAARYRYLTGLWTYCQSLPLAALGGNEGIDQGPTLDDVYIDLNL